MKRSTDHGARITAAMCMILASAGVALGLQDKWKKRDNKDRQEIAGKVVCIGCALEQQDGGANSECTRFAKHAQGLLAADGTLWTFVNNAKGNWVITNAKLKDKEIRVLGWKFPKAQYVEVSKFQLKDGEKWVPYDYCKT